MTTIVCRHTESRVGCRNGLRPGRDALEASNKYKRHRRTAPVRVTGAVRPRRQPPHAPPISNSAATTNKPTERAINTGSETPQQIRVHAEQRGNERLGLRGGIGGEFHRRADEGQLEGEERTALLFRDHEIRDR
jgi:hypothetical protein